MALLKAGEIVAHRFAIESMAGQGGMGEVYCARDRLKGDSKVALKVLHSVRAETAARFLREAQIAGELLHPGIARAFSHGTLASGEMYLVMEWLHGEDLEKRLAKGPLDIASALRYMKAALFALSAAHAQGIVHRDIKPANLFLSENARDSKNSESEIYTIKLIDFGIAKMISEHAFTRTGAMLGTPAYMAPEQFRASREVDARADLYSIGCVLFECLTGRPPFVETGHLLGLISRVLMEPPPRPRSLVADIPIELDDIVVALLDKEPSRRPQSAASVIEALERVEMKSTASAPPPALSPHFSLTSGEQKIVSAVLILPVELVAPANTTENTVNSKEDDTQLAPELDETLMAGLARMVARMGGSVEALPDGTIMVVVSGQGSASDQAVSAARAALFAKATSSGKCIAVATGQGALSSGLLCSQALNKAVAMISAYGRRQRSMGKSMEWIDRSSVLMDELSAGLVDGRFRVEAEDAFFVLRAEDPQGEPTRKLLGKAAPFAGRQRELATLLAHFDEVCEESCAMATLVLGEAGMGKSRLGYECLRSLSVRAGASSPFSVWMGRADLLSQDTPFGLLAQAFRTVFELKEGEPGELRLEKIRARVSVSIPVKNPLFSPISAFLGELLGCPLPESEEPRLAQARKDPVLMGDQIRWAVEEFIQAECSKTPIVLVLEDLHWGDFSSLKLVDSLLRQLREKPFWVLALSRSSVFERFPKLWSTRNIQELRLGMLSRKASESIVRQCLGDKASPALLQKVVERAGGHALLLEELVRAAAAQPNLSGDLEPSAPETVLAVVQARLERLEAYARRVLRAASVFGETFLLGGLCSLLGADRDDEELCSWMAYLTGEELFDELPSSRFPGEREYRFRHALVRDASYAMLTQSDQNMGHKLAADFLEAKGETRAAVLAEHCDRAGDWARGARYHLRASWEALEGSDFEGALFHAKRAMGGPESNSHLSVEEMGEAWMLEAQAYQWTGAFEDAARAARQAMSKLPRASSRWFEATEALAIALGRRVDQQGLLALCAELCELSAEGPGTPGAQKSEAYVIAAVRVGVQAYIAGLYDASSALFGTLSDLLADDSQCTLKVRAMLNVLRANREAFAYRFDETARLLERAADEFDAISDWRSACSQRLDAGMFRMDVGQYQEARPLLESALLASERLSLSRITSVARAYLGALQSRLGELDRAMETLFLAEKELNANGDMRVGASARVHMARVCVWRGDLELAARKADEAIGLVATMPRFRARAHAMRAWIYVLEGKASEALSCALVAMEILERLGRLGTDEAFVRLSYAKALLISGDRRAADAMILIARQRLWAHADQLRDAKARESFLYAIAEHEEVLQWAQRVESEGA